MKTKKKETTLQRLRRANELLIIIGNTLFKENDKLRRALFEAQTTSTPKAKGKGRAGK
jgi:hypothetical protein